MSWAAMARKAKETPQPTEEESMAKKVVVVAVDPAKGAQAAKLANSHQLTPHTFNLPTPQKGCLVLDANAFIKGLDDYVSRADVLITIPQVIEECKDAGTRELLERLPVNLIVLDPTQESIHKVVDMASATGDLGTLSRTDIRLCALGLDVATQLKALRRAIKPRGTKINPGDGVTIRDDAEEGEELDADEIADADAVYAEGDDSDDDGASSGDDEEGEEAEEDAAAPEADYGGSDGEGEWITSDNIEDVIEKQKEENDGVNVDPYASGFATATSDFPMQNVLLHLGVPIVGPAGFLIKELRQWLLRCHACFCLVTDTTKQFCPDCGSGNTLKRVAYTITENGEKLLHINFRRHISTRGNVYTLPKPRGGRNGTNRTLVLREDQLAPAARSRKKRDGVDDDLKGFGDSRTKVRDVMSLRNTSSYKKFNMNEKKKLRAARRK